MKNYSISKRQRPAIKYLTLLLIIMLVMVTCLAGCGSDSADPNQPDDQAQPADTDDGNGELPKPEITGGARGEFGIDKNINEATIDNYLGRDDVVYRDMRMLEDPAQYENIGGDRFLSGYIDGFEVVPFPLIKPVSGLPGAVGETYTGETLFAYNEDYIMAPAYEESMSILEELFPKDKVIFLMCGGGGYAGMMKDFLVALGWDPEKIYNVGGYWFYNGSHNIEVKKEEGGNVTYDFDSVPYHDIDFSKLTPLKDTSWDTDVSEIIMGADKVEIEQDTTFQLKAIIRPITATDQWCEWESSDESTVYVDAMGVIRGLKPGTATITAKSQDGKCTDTCEVSVYDREETEHVNLSDVASEYETFTSNDPNAIMKEFNQIENDMDQAVKDGYYEFDGEGYNITDLWQEEYDKVNAKAEEAIAVRVGILNKLVDEKKSFILLVYTKNCDERPYQAAESAVTILKERGIPYFYTNDMVSEFDRSLYESKLDYGKVATSAAVIFKDGELYATLDPDAYSIKSDEELINWFSKYIDIE